MGRKSLNASVEVFPNEHLSSAISRFKKKCRNSGMHFSLKTHYVSKSEKRRLKKHLARKRMRKHLRRRDRYYRNIKKDY